VAVLWGCYNIVSEISNNWFGLNCRFETGKGENFFAYTLIEVTHLRMFYVLLVWLFALSLGCGWLVTLWFHDTGGQGLDWGCVAVGHQLHAEITTFKRMCIKCSIFEIRQVFGKRSYWMYHFWNQASIRKAELLNVPFLKSGKYSESGATECTIF
jgi:hypothetical protein